MMGHVVSKVYNIATGSPDLPMVSLSWIEGTDLNNVPEFAIHVFAEQKSILISFNYTSKHPLAAKLSFVEKVVWKPAVFYKLV